MWYKRAANVEIDLYEECVGAHHGQLDLVMRATVKGAYKQIGQIGHVDYAEYNGEVYIKWISVDENFQRQKVATRMLQEIQKLHSDCKMNYGYTTPSGTALIDKLKETELKSDNIVNMGH